ncbi:MAG: cellulase family glycosylhydrolase [Anaerolineae bacterium]|nr:cellulase family glycosylhydrolase [Anaerolineae bacterium]
MTNLPQRRMACILILLAMVLVLGGCLKHKAHPTPTPTPTPHLTRPTPTPRPTNTPFPTPTPAPATSTPTPTNTPLPLINTPTPMPTSTPLNTSGPATMLSPDYGAQAFLWWRPEVADRDLQLLKDAGFNWVKQTFDWKLIEGAGPGQFDWSHADRVVQQVNEKGLRLLARVSLDPEAKIWAGPPPQNVDAYADFLFALASRYRGRIHAYQIWNEPNLAREWGGKRPNPAEYAIMLKKAYAAIKRADPNAIVITAGMAPTGTDNEIAMPDERFYDELYQAIGGSGDGYFDMLGVHAAGYKAPPELDPAEAAANKPLYGGERFFAFRHVEDIRRIMERYGDTNRRVVILEFGWTSDPIHPEYAWHAVSEEEKAAYLVRAYQWAQEHWRPWIGLMSLIFMPDVKWTEKDEQYWWSIIGPAYPDIHWRPAYMELCLYLNKVQGRPRCKYAPKH